MYKLTDSEKREFIDNAGKYCEASIKAIHKEMRDAVENRMILGDTHDKTEKRLHLLLENHKHIKHLVECFKIELEKRGATV